MKLLFGILFVCLAILGLMIVGRTDTILNRLQSIENRLVR